MKKQYSLFGGELCGGKLFGGKLAGVLACGLVAMSAFVGSANAHTLEDVTAAKGDTVKLKKIVAESADDAPVQTAALAAMDRAEAVKYLEDKVIAANPLGRQYVFGRAAQADALPLARYAEGFGLAAKQGSGLYALQYYYIVKLQKEKDYTKALAESKRLFGLAPPTSVSMGDVVALIAGLIKVETFSRTKSAGDAVVAMNQFLTDVKDGTQKSAWFAIPYPAAPANVASEEKNPIAALSTLALLYDGKYDEAKAAADGIFIEATDAGNTEIAITLAAQAINGKAQKPDAANTFLQQFEG